MVVLRGLGEVFLRIPICSPETSRSSSKVTKMSSRKIGNLSSRMRLVSPEGRKIVQIGSLARWKRIFPAILGCRVSRLLSLPSGPEGCDDR